MPPVLKLLAAVVLLATLAGCASTPPLPQTEETVTWKIRNHTGDALVVRFFSQNRDVYWGADHGIYYITDNKEHVYSLTCRTTEKICYGAWYASNRNGPYWGTGPYNKEACEDCCMICRAGNTSSNGLVD